MLGSEGNRPTWLEWIIDRFGAPIAGMCRHQYILFMLRFSMRLFLILAAYYLMKPVREQLVLSEGSAELRSYAIALQALGLLFLYPIYVHLSHKIVNEALYAVVTIFFMGCLLLFIIALQMGWHIGFTFFVWTGIYSVMQLAQFWALVTDFVDQHNGEYIIPLVAVGGTIGAMSGSVVAGMMIGWFDAQPVAMLVLAELLLLFSMRRRRFDAFSRLRETPLSASFKALYQQISAVVGSDALRLIIFFVLLLNMLNSIGEYYLAHMVTEQWPHDSDRIGAFYADYYLAVNILTVLLQAAAVPWFYRRFGTGSALVLVAAVDLIMFGYGVLTGAVLSAFSIIKVMENAVGYSIGNTLRQLLFVPFSTKLRYHGMMLSNGFFWRVGDILQGAVIFIIVDALGWNRYLLLVFGVMVSVMWIWLSIYMKGQLNQPRNRGNVVTKDCKI